MVDLHHWEGSLFSPRPRAPTMPSLRTATCRERGVIRRLASGIAIDTGLFCGCGLFLLGGGFGRFAIGLPRSSRSANPNRTLHNTAPVNGVTPSSTTLTNLPCRLNGSCVYIVKFSREYCPAASGSSGSDVELVLEMV